MLFSMDMSMRSSGIMALTPDNQPIGFEVIKTNLADFPDHEDTIIFIVGEVMRFIHEFKDENNDAFVIEGLAYAGQNASKDVIDGIFWAIRCAVWTGFPEMPIGAVPVESWRATILDKADRKYAKENYSPKKEALKIATVNHLPDDIHELFTNYCECSGFDKKTMYDLADSFFLGVYRNSL